MRDLLDQVEACAATPLYYVALMSALALPDICGAMEADDGRATGARYVAWFDRWVAPKYAAHGQSNLTGEDCYQFRCALLHQGRTKHPKSRWKRILFLEPSERFRFHNNVLEDALNIDIPTFGRDVVASARDWLTTVEDTHNFKTNLAESVRRHPSGLAPYIVGIPVIS